MHAAQHGDVECIELLLAYMPVVQVKAADDYGGTALMLVAENGHVDCIKLLLAWLPEEHGCQRSRLPEEHGCQRLWLPIPMVRQH